MILNLLHRPAGGKDHRLFVLQQDIAHELGLQVTLLVDLASMYDEKTIQELKRYEQEYGDELGMWFVGFERATGSTVSSAALRAPRPRCARCTGVCASSTGLSRSG
jgi:hypothetical protein